MFFLNLIVVPVHVIEAKVSFFVERASMTKSTMNV